MLSTQEIIAMQAKCADALAGKSTDAPLSNEASLKALLELSSEVIETRNKGEKSELIHAAQCDRSFVEGAHFGWTHATAKKAKQFYAQIESMENQIFEVRKGTQPDGYLPLTGIGFSDDLKILVTQCREQLQKGNTARALILVRAILDQVRDSTEKSQKSPQDAHWAKKLAWELEGIHADVTIPEGAGFDDVCLNTLNRVKNALYDFAKQDKGPDVTTSDNKTTTRPLNETERRTISAVLGDEVAKTFVRVTAFNDRPEASESVTTREEIATWRELFFSLARELGCLPSTFARGNVHVINKARELMAASKNSIPLQDAWVAAGGNPEIQATREDLVQALKMLDQICDEADGDAPKFIPVRAYADVFTAEQWKGITTSRSIIASDGSGYWMQGLLMQSNISAFMEKPDWATHVAWFNK